MKKLFLISCLLAASAMASLQAQNLYFTKTGHVSFFSSTPMENIEAHNRKATSMINTSTGEVEFSLLIIAFEFEKALMQDHFNENYMESAKYPKSVFKGRITNLDKINFAANGTYPADITGKLTIHGVTREISTKGTFTVKDGKIQSSAGFLVKPADYNIAIPKLVSDKIAKDIKVSVENTYEPFRK